jgi:anti-sigma factor RsiW
MEPCYGLRRKPNGESDLTLALSERDRVRLEAHLSDCPHCSEYLAQLRATIDALGQATPEDLPDQAVDDLVELYRRWRTG